jgi:hypothetical protein
MAWQSSWQPYGLDRAAQKLVLQYRDRGVLNESHKMRLAVAYGLERFWGEHLRFKGKTSPKQEDINKSDYWKATWDALVEILKEANFTIPNDSVSVKDTKQIQAMSEKLWTLSIEEQRIAIAVLTQLCDSLVWWTQRYKTREVE